MSTVNKFGKRAAIHILMVIFLFCCLSGKGLAKIPEPDHIIYGIAGLGVTEVSIDVNGETLASYVMHSNPNTGFFYILRVPMDSMDPQTPGTARPGDTAYLYADGILADVGEVVIGESGTLQRIDLIGDIDSEPDGMRDAWELEYFETLSRDGTGDFDGDGFSDLEEHDQGTDPTDPASYPVNAAVSLSEGFNMIAVPYDQTSGMDLKDILPEIGDSSEIDRVYALDTTTGTYVTFIPEDINNPSFILAGGEGLIVYALIDREIVYDSNQCPSLPLVSGTNLISISCPEEGYTAFQYLNDHAAENVKSIQRYSVAKGTFETASIGAYSETMGVNFPIVAGEGYIVTKE